MNDQILELENGDYLQTQKALLFISAQTGCHSGYISLFNILSGIKYGIHVYFIYLLIIIIFYERHSVT